MAGDHRHVLVVARVFTQLRYSRAQVAHVQVPGLVQAANQQNGTDQQRDQAAATGRKPTDALPKAAAEGFLATQFLGIGRRQAHERQQDRQQHLVGDDHHRNAEGGGDRQLSDHLDIHQCNHHKAQGIGQQCHGAGDEQLLETVARSRDAIGAGQCFQFPGVGHLHGVGHANGENQKWHQNRHGVQPQACQWQDAEQPHHRHYCANQRPAGQHQRTAVPEQQHGGNHKGHHEEQQHARSTFGDITNGFGKANDVDADIAGLVFLADFFQLRRDVLQVQPLTAGGVLFLQGGHDHGRGQVIGNDAPNPVGFERAFTYLGQLLGLACVIGGHQVTAGEALLHHFGVTHIGGEQRCHRAALHAVEKKHLVRYLAQHGHGRWREDLALVVLHRDQNLVSPTEVFLVLEEGPHVFVVQRDHLEEPGLDLQVGRAVAQTQGQQDKQCQ
ncbi:hypothetical protein D3C76_622010 [compost metagenome]